VTYIVKVVARHFVRSKRRRYPLRRRRFTGALLAVIVSGAAAVTLIAYLISRAG
jgi:hypothetical protein